MSQQEQIAKKIADKVKAMPDAQIVDIFNKAYAYEREQVGKIENIIVSAREEVINEMESKVVADPVIESKIENAPADDK